MKLTIEIDDDLVNKAVEAQLGKSIAASIEQLFAVRAEEIIAKKMARFEPVAIAMDQVKLRVDSAVKAELERALGPDSYDRHKQIKAIIATAAAQIIKSATT